MLDLFPHLEPVEEGGDGQPVGDPLVLTPQDETNLTLPTHRLTTVTVHLHRLTTTVSKSRLLYNNVSIQATGRVSQFRILQSVLRQRWG